jgi:2-ketocyclohexanecarboxyl-CoA hydrolase
VADDVLVDQRGDVVVTLRGDATWITLNRPDRRNAYDPDMAAAIVEALEGSTRSRAVVITGVPGSFCAGGALTGLAEPDVTAMRGLYRGSLRLFDAIRNHPRPVVAAVNGPAAGGGNELVIACDLAIAAESATFGQTGPRVGSAPVTGATNVLGVQIGEKRAKEMAFLCRRYSAAQALELGLVNRVVPDDELDKAVDDLMARATRGSRASKAWGKQTMYAQLDRPERDAYTTAIEVMAAASQLPGAREGMAAFLEKRHAVWPD